MGDGSGKKKSRTRRPTRRSISTLEEGSKQPQKNVGPRRRTSAAPTEDESIQKNPGRRTTRTPAKKMPEEVEAACQDFVDYHDFFTVRQEFKTLADIVPEDDKHKDCCLFKQRNRNDVIPCYDATRVKVKEPADPSCDFVHANKVVYEKADHDYILAQAPLQSTIEDFWRVVFQENSHIIVLLCPFYEQGQQSAEQFWPMNAGEYKHYGKMFINNKKVDTKEAINIYTLEVLPDGLSNSNITMLYHFASWEANGITPSRSILRLRNLLRLEDPGPMTVVSSEGVNRASCFVAIDIVLSRLLKGIKTRLGDVAKAIRQARALAFSSGELQYLFAVQTALDYIRAKDPKFKEAVEKFNGGVRTQI